MIQRKSFRLSLGDILIFCHCDKSPKRISDYFHLLPPRYHNLSFEASRKAIREAYGLLTSVGLMRRYRSKEVKGYQYAITAKGQSFYDEHNVPDNH